MKGTLKRTLWIILALFILLNFVSATTAYKFTHFYNPREVIMKPANEKNAWDRTKEILFGKNFTKKPNDPIPPGFSKVIFTTKDRLKLEGWYSTTANARGAVALFHGHGNNKSGVLEEAYSFLEMGYNVLLLDFRAHGNSAGNTCAIGYAEAEDVKLAYDFLKNQDEKNVILWGISMGAVAITHAMYKYRLDPSKVILEMPFGTIKEAVAARLRIMQLPREPLATLLTFWGGAQHGFWAFSVKPEEFVKRIYCPVLLQVGEHDPRVTQRETHKIFSNLREPKELVMYSKSGHESLCQNEQIKWLSNVSAFLHQ